MSNMMYVYVIRSREGYRYTGQCRDLPQRLADHATGTRTVWTRRGHDWVPTYLETYPTRRAALARERWLKSGVGREYLAAHEAVRLDARS